MYLFDKIRTSADQHGTGRTQHGVVNRQTRRQATGPTQYSNYSCRVAVGQYTRLTPVVNLDSGGGGLTKGTKAQHWQQRTN
jgi:hypothetical protein